MRRLFRIAAAAATALALSGCPVAHPDYPDRACKLSSDCFHDEICAANVCTSVDAGAPDMSIADFATPVDLASVGDAE